MLEKFRVLRYPGLFPFFEKTLLYNSFRELITFDIYVLVLTFIVCVKYIAGLSHEPVHDLKSKHSPFLPNETKYSFFFFF